MAAVIVSWPRERWEWLRATLRTLIRDEVFDGDDDAEAKRAAADLSVALDVPAPPLPPADPPAPVHELRAQYERDRRRTG